MAGWMDLPDDLCSMIVCDWVAEICDLSAMDVACVGSYRPIFLSFLARAELKSTDNDHARCYSNVKPGNGPGLLQWLVSRRVRVPRYRLNVEHIACCRLANPSIRAGGLIGLKQIDFVQPGDSDDAECLPDDLAWFLADCPSLEYADFERWRSLRDDQLAVFHVMRLNFVSISAQLSRSLSVEAMMNFVVSQRSTLRTLLSSSIYAPHLTTLATNCRNLQVLDITVCLSVSERVTVEFLTALPNNCLRNLTIGAFSHDIVDAILQHQRSIVSLTAMVSSPSTLQCIPRIVRGCRPRIQNVYVSNHIDLAILEASGTNGSYVDVYKPLSDSVLVSILQCDWFDRTMPERRENNNVLRLSGLDVTPNVAEAVGAFVGPMLKAFCCKSTIDHQLLRVIVSACPLLKILSYDVPSDVTDDIVEAFPVYHDRLGHRVIMANN